MDLWNLAPYWGPALAVVVAVIAWRVAHSRSAGARRPRHEPPPVDVFYLDSSHIGEPQGPGGAAEVRPDARGSRRKR